MLETLTNFINDWGKAGAILLVVASYFIEVSKIKINPITFIFTTIGKAINKPAITIIESIQKEQERFMKEQSEINKELLKKLKELSEEQKINEIKRIRAEIMSFATSCKKHEEHNEQQFQTIIGLHTEYETLVEQTDYTNGVLEEDFNYIMRVYRNCVSDGVFYPRNCYINPANES